MTTSDVTRTLWALNISSEAEQPDILRTFAEQIWHEAFNVGLNEQARVDNGYPPITNPYTKETP